MGDLERRVGYPISTLLRLSGPMMTARCLKGGEAEAETQPQSRKWFEVPSACFRNVLDSFQSAPRSLVLF